MRQIHRFVAYNHDFSIFLQKLCDNLDRHHGDQVIRLVARALSIHRQVLLAGNRFAVEYPERLRAQPRKPKVHAEPDPPHQPFF